jgi:hypothetical protein
MTADRPQPADPRLHLPTNPVADAPTEYAALGLANSHGGVVGVLRFRFADDTWRGFPYYGLGGLAYDPALGIELGFPAALVRVRGRNRFPLFTLVGDHAVRWCWEADRLAIGRLAAGQERIDRVAERATAHVHLGAEPAPAARRVAPLLRPPAADGWARTVVESRMSHPGSGSRRALLTRPRAPRAAHRSNRRPWLFQLPSRSGSSRQGAAVRATDGTASTNRRLS